MDISLIPVDELIKEIENRSSAFICAFCPNDFQKDKEMVFYYGKGSYHRSTSMSNILNNDVLNNWNGELKTLQRINDEDDCDDDTDRIN